MLGLCLIKRKGTIKVFIKLGSGQRYLYTNIKQNQIL